MHGGTELSKLRSRGLFARAENDSILALQDSMKLQEVRRGHQHTGIESSSPSDLNVEN